MPPRPTLGGAGVGGDGRRTGDENARRRAGAFFFGTARTANQNFNNECGSLQPGGERETGRALHSRHQGGGRSRTARTGRRSAPSGPGDDVLRPADARHVSMATLGRRRPSVRAGSAGLAGLPPCFFCRSGSRKRAPVRNTPCPRASSTTPPSPAPRLSRRRECRHPARRRGASERWPPRRERPSAPGPPAFELHAAPLLVALRASSLVPSRFPRNGAGAAYRLRAPTHSHQAGLEPQAGLS